MTKSMTPKQQREFLAVVEHWGEIFRVYSGYGFLIDAGTVQRATPEQVEKHYAALAADLERLGREVKAAVDAGDFKQAAGLAKDAADALEELADRQQEAPRLVTLSDRGRKLADKYLAKRRALEAGQ